jgi:hypothetical protein
MATVSGSIVFNPPMLEIMEEAWERATTRELRTGYDFRTATRSYNLLMLEWQTRGYNLWTVTSAPITLVANQASYALPAGSLDVVSLTYAASSTSERALQRLSLPDYTALPNKAVPGAPLTYVAYRSSTPTVTLYPVPSSASGTMTVWYTRRINDAGNASHLADVPMLFIPALIAGLAYHIAKKTPDGMNRIEMLKADYEQLYDDATSDDRDKADTRIVPQYNSI